ncbi:MAG: AraC family transcriptional regulator [Myxococcales bacterium]
MERLLEQASRHFPAPANGPQQFAQPLDGLVLLQQDRPSPLEASLYEPVLCLILQGRKQLSLGAQTLSFGPGECLLVSHDLPVSSRITAAPYLALVFEVEVATVRKLREEVEDATRAESSEVVAKSSDQAEEGKGRTPSRSLGGLGGGRGEGRAAQTHRADPGLLDALSRYLALAGSPADLKVLGPLVSKEIHYRLLTAPFGGMLRRLTRPDSSASAIASAIGHIRGDLRSPIAIPSLARRVGMSASSFHQHFRAVTSTTPLQYQKELRLLEARRLLRTAGTSVTTAAYDVGYESPSQFSREYARRFGVPPSQDLATETDA